MGSSDGVAKRVGAMLPLPFGMESGELLGVFLLLAGVLAAEVSNFSRHRRGGGRESREALRVRSVDLEREALHFGGPLPLLAVEESRRICLMSQSSRGGARPAPFQSVGSGVLEAALRPLHISVGPQQNAGDQQPLPGQTGGGRVLGSLEVPLVGAAVGERLGASLAVTVVGHIVPANLSMYQL